MNALTQHPWRPRGSTPVGIAIVITGCVFVSLPLAATAAKAAETVWIEAEHLNGIRGFCWPMGKPEMKKTDGHWGLSGPGWAAEWNQGGESGFLSIATGADDDRAVASKTIEVPAAGKYFVWVRYGDRRETPERFQVHLEQPGQPAWVGRYGETAVIDEDNEAKLYWGWSFAWAAQEANLQKGPALLKLASTTKDTEPRQIDCLVLTTDPTYRPLLKERPKSATWDVLAGYRENRRGRGGQAHFAPKTAQNEPVPDESRMGSKLESLVRNQPAFELPASWKLRTFRDKGFVYLWNVSHTSAVDTWLSDKPDRVPVPYNVNDDDTRKEFEARYAGKQDVPIFGDPRIVPTFHGVGPGVFATDPKTGEVQDLGKRFAKWLDEHPDRAWGMMMNYHPGVPIGDAGQALFAKYRDRYVGSISGESLGYFDPDPKAMQAATSAATTRRQLVEAFTPLTLQGNADKYRAVFGKDLDKNPYQDVIACLSVGNIAFVPLCYQWGAKTAGYESSAMTSSMLGMRWAFMRGAARQNEGLTATYRSCNFGDASTIFSNGSSFHTPQAILDNYYSVYSGAGMTWYKMDIWYQYMAGASMFYHEQGFDEFWRPGGTAAAGVQEVQLSPKGKLVDRFLRVTAQPDFDRGQPYTPVAFLVDFAHGWEPGPFWPNAFKNWHGHQDKFRYGDHEKMLEEYFDAAYYPIGPESEKPMTATNEVYLPGVFGDVFDVIFAYPEMERWRTIDTYPVVIATGDIELTAAEGERLAKYVENGGTLLVADEHLTGPGAAALKLPAAKPQSEASAYRWLGDAAEQPSQAFRFRPLDVTNGRALATTPEGECFCADFDRGRGRLIYLSVPRGLGIDRRAIPAVPRLLAHLTRGVMPIEVQGDVEWLVNRTATGWNVLLMNPAGQLKPQQGITPTDYRENRSVTIQCKVPVTSARDRLAPDDQLTLKAGQLNCEVLAGGIRIVELK